MFEPKLVKFKCCNTEKVFKNPREFSMCECGKSGYDAGDGFYARYYGYSDNIEVISLTLINYTKQYNLNYNKSTRKVTKTGEDWYIYVQHSSSLDLIFGGKWIGHFTHIKHAYKRVKKLKWLLDNNPDNIV